MRVWPNDEGICPSCRRNVFDFSDVDPDKSTLVIRPSSRMPKVCIDCGLPTGRLAKIVSYGSTTVDGASPDSGWLSLAFVLSLIFPLLSLVRGSDVEAPGRVSVKMKVRVPQCRMCSVNEIEPVYVNHESATMKLVVHKRFKAEFRELNAT